MFELVLLFIIIVLLLFLIHERTKFKRLNKEYERLNQDFSSLSTELQALKSNFSLEVSKKTQELFNEWKQRELDNQKKIIYDAIRKEYEAKFSEWKQEEEKKIRQDAIERSASTILGKVGEQLAPLLLFSKHNINPKDVRFIGTPVDFIAFKGLSDDNPEEIVFIEVKSGKTANLTSREKAIRDIIRNKKVSWLLVHLPREIEEIAQ